MTDFGSNQVPDLAIPWQQSELDFTNENFGKNGQRVVIWPICKVHIQTSIVEILTVFQLL